ncbi:MAG: hypothetical protein K6357_07840 [Elusimicrobiota bacterium]
MKLLFRKPFILSFVIFILAAGFTITNTINNNAMDRIYPFNYFYYAIDTTRSCFFKLFFYMPLSQFYYFIIANISHISYFSFVLLFYSVIYYLTIKIIDSEFKRNKSSLLLLPFFHYIHS